MKNSIREKVNLNNDIRQSFEESVEQGSVENETTFKARKTALVIYAHNKLPELVKMFFETDMVDITVLSDICRLHWKGVSFFEVKSGSFRIADESQRKILKDLAEQIDSEHTKYFSKMSDEYHDAFVDMVLTFLVGSDFDCRLAQLICCHLRSEKLLKAKQDKENEQLEKSQVSETPPPPPASLAEYSEEVSVPVKETRNIYQQICDETVALLKRKAKK